MTNRSSTTGISIPFTNTTTTTTTTTTDIPDFYPPRNISMPDTEPTIKATPLPSPASSKTRLQLQIKKRAGCYPDCTITVARYIFVDSMDEFQAKLALRDPPELEWHVRGCPHLLTDTPLGFDFQHACERLNFGYWNYRPGGRADSRIARKLHAQFWEDLQQTCGREGDAIVKLDDTKVVDQVDLVAEAGADIDEDVVVNTKEEKEKKCVYLAWLYLDGFNKATEAMAEKEMKVDAETPDFHPKYEENMYEYIDLLMRPRLELLEMGYLDDEDST